MSVSNRDVYAGDGWGMNRHDAKTAKFKEPDPASDAVARAVLDAAFEVHRFLGPGFLDSVYEEALATELRLRDVAFARQVVIGVDCKGSKVGHARLDLLVGGKLVVELKAVEQLAPIHLAQVLAYLKATGHTLGRLITFNVPELRRGIRRVVRSLSLQTNWRSWRRGGSSPEDVRGSRSLI